MDPISLIVAAVVAGASAGLTDAVKDAVNRAYTSLRTKLVERFKGSLLFKQSLEQVEQTPTEESKAALAELLTTKQISADDELVSLSEQVVNATGLTITQIQELGAQARIEQSAQTIEGLPPDAQARILQMQKLGEGATLTGSPQGVKYADRPKS